MKTSAALLLPPLVIMSVFVRALSWRSATMGMFVSGGSIFSSARAKCESRQFMSTAVEIDANPLADKKVLPKFNDILPIHVIPAIQTDLTALTNNFKSKYAIISLSFDESFKLSYFQ